MPVLDHGLIRGDHLTDLDTMAADMLAAGKDALLVEAAVVDNLRLLGYCGDDNWLEAWPVGAKIVAESRNPRDAMPATQVVDRCPVDSLTLDSQPQV